MKKSFVKAKALFAFAVMFTMMVVLGSFKLSVSAGSNEKFFNLATNNQFVEGKFTSTNSAQYHYYTITLPSDGYLSVICKNDDINGHWGRYIEVELFNKDATGDYFFRMDPETGNSAEERSVALVKGQYTLKITDEEGKQGSYKVKAKFNAAGNNEKEPNNIFDQAMQLPENTEITGFLCANDDKDYYKINLNTERTIRLYFSGTDNQHYYINDNNYLEKWSYSWASGEHYTDQTLPAGTNYIVVKRASDTTYKLKWGAAPIFATDVSIAGSEEVAVGGTTGLSAVITPSNATDKRVEWTSYDTRVATVDANGIVRGVSVGTTRISAKTLDESNKYAEFDIVVKPGAIEKVKAKAKKNKNVKLSWKSQNNVSVYQYQYCKNKNFNKKVKGKKINGYNLRTSTVRFAKKGTFYVRMRGLYDANGKTYYGDWSQPVKVKVK